MQTYKNFFCAIVVFWILADFTLAMSLTVNVTGTVDSVSTYGDFSFDGSVAVGSTMSGSCSYDPDEAVDLNSDEYLGEYLIPSISMSIGNYDFTESFDPHRNLVKFRVGVTDISYLVQTTSGITYWNDVPLEGRRDTHIKLIDLCNASVSGENDDLPTTFPDISLFTYRNEFEVISGGNFFITGTLDSIEAVPEPATIGLFALTGLITLRKKKCLKKAQQDKKSYRYPVFR